MRKTLFFIIFLFLISISNVNAEPYVSSVSGYYPSCYENGECILLCQYKTTYEETNESYDTYATIFYNAKDENFLLSWYPPFIYGTSVSGKYARHDVVGTWQKILDYDGVWDFANTSGVKEYSNMDITNFSCPAYVYIDTFESFWIPSYDTGGNEVCISSTKENCVSVKNDRTEFGTGSKFKGIEKNFDFGDDFIAKQYDGILNEIKNNYIDDINNGNLSKEELETLIKKTLNINYQKFLNGYDAPPFMVNSSKTAELVLNIERALYSLIDEQKNEVNEQFNNGNISESQRDEALQNLENFKEIVKENLPSVLSSFNKGILEGWTADFVVTNECESYLGNPLKKGDPAYYLQFAFNVIKYAALVLLLVLTIMEFVKATASSNQDAMKKAIQNAIKRVVLAVIIFLLPSLIKFLLTVLGAYSPSTCGIK